MPHYATFGDNEPGPANERLPDHLARVDLGSVDRSVEELQVFEQATFLVQQENRKDLVGTVGQSPCGARLGRFWPLRFERFQPRSDLSDLWLRFSA
jgi:hypothetical protein